MDNQKTDAPEDSSLADTGHNATVSVEKSDRLASSQQDAAHSVTSSSNTTSSQGRETPATNSTSFALNPQNLSQHQQQQQQLSNMSLQQFVLPSVAIPGSVMNAAAQAYMGYAGFPNMNMATGAGVKRPAPSMGDLYSKIPRMDPNAINPSVISAAKTHASEDPPFELKSDDDIAKLSPSERRRYERNLREQQRSHRISQQIKQLRDVLSESNVPYKPNKFSILVSVVEYIKQLQSRAITLDDEHKRLQKTLKETNDILSSGQAPSSSSGEESEESTDGPSDSDLAFVRGLDYDRVFDASPFALAIATLDGRLLSCNQAMRKMILEKPSEDHPISQSIFIFIKNHEDIFEAMADLLKRSGLASETGGGTIVRAPFLHWTGNVETAMGKTVLLSITLANTSQGDPKYFSLSAIEDVSRTD